MIDIRNIFGGPLDRDQVLHLFRQTIAEELGDHRLRASPRDPFAFELIRAGSDEAALSVNAHNIVQEILGNHYGRREAGHRIAQFAGLIAAALAPGGVDSRAIYLALRHHDYTSAAGTAILSDTGAGDLRMVIAEDRGAYLSLPSDRALAEAGLTPAQALRIAGDNLEGVLPRLTIYDDGEGVSALVLQDYEWLSTSLLLTPEVLQWIARRRGSDAVLVAAPTTDALHMIDAGRAEAAAVLGARMRAGSGSARMQSECLFHLNARGEPNLRVAYAIEDGRLAARN